jgi:hypothetical protein
MNDIIEIGDLKKGDSFIYNEVEYLVSRADNYFRAFGITKDFFKVEISGISSVSSNFKVKLISRANENTDI